MDWLVEYADKLEFLENIADQTGNLPLALANRPFLSDFAIPYYNVFMELSNQRTAGMNGADPILFSEIAVYLELYNLRDLPMVVEIIVECDRHYLTKQREQLNGQNVNTKINSKRGRGGSLSRAAK